AMPPLPPRSTLFPYTTLFRSAFDYYAGAADKNEGSSYPLGEDYASLSINEPVGVTAHIIPWNYPVSTAARSIAPALAAGCSVVRSEEHTSELQSRENLVCRLL